jgi:predicted nuclease of restriction endonuclease-like (RecB) superfamily
MRRFVELYPDIQIHPTLSGELPWHHHVILMEKTNSPEERLFYMKAAVEYGWSNRVMVHQIESDLYHRQGKAVTNFKDKLPTSQSDLANRILKDPYDFDFLGLGKQAYEREVENELIRHMEKFLVELGTGFAFVGRQYHLVVSKKDFYIDLLFYHLKLRCFVVIELKDKEFKPEYAGKMNFYLSAVDDLVKHSNDQPSIGFILCKTKDNVLAEYTLRDMTKPIGLAEYRLTEALPKEIKTNLPSIEELEKEFKRIEVGKDSNG